MAHFLDGICAIGLFFYRKAVFLDASLAIGMMIVEKRRILEYIYVRFAERLKS